MAPIESPPPSVSKARWFLIAIIVALAAGSIGYRLLVLGHLEQTAAMFIGLPAILAIAIAFLPTGHSATVMILKILTICLLLSSVLFGEGFICILMAAPLVLGAGCIVGLIIDVLDARNRKRIGPGNLLLLPVLLLGVEGVVPGLSFPRHEVVTREMIVQAPVASVQAALAAQPRFTRPLPAFLRLKFPLPVEATGSGLNAGDLRTIHFAGGEGKPGDLVLRVASTGAGQVRFEVLKDSSHIAHWMDWRESEVIYEPVSPTSTRVRWTIRFDRRLDPAWYFKPWERYAVGLSARYLIENLATPNGKM